MLNRISELRQIFIASVHQDLAKYAERNHTGSRKWSSKIVQNALSLFPKNENKEGEEA